MAQVGHALACADLVALAEQATSGILSTPRAWIPPGSAIVVFADGVFCESTSWKAARRTENGERAVMRITLDSEPPTYDGLMRAFLASAPAIPIEDHWAHGVLQPATHWTSLVDCGRNAPSTVHTSDAARVTCLACIARELALSARFAALLASTKAGK